MTTQNVHGQSLQWSAYGLRALVVLIATPIANAIVYLIADVLSAIPDTVLIQPMSEPITIVPVIMASVMGALGGVIVYAVLLRFTPQPRRIFIIMAVVVLIIAALPTFSIGAPVAMIIALNVMHVAAAAIIVGVLTR